MIASAAVMTVQSNLLKLKKRLAGTVCNLLEYSLRTTQHEPGGTISVDQVLDQQLTWPEQKPEEEEAFAEHRTTFVDAL
jgi:hypothetical protein